MRYFLNYLDFIDRKLVSVYPTEIYAVLKYKLTHQDHAF